MLVLQVVSYFIESVPVAWDWARLSLGKAAPMILTQQNGYLILKDEL